MTVRFSGTAGFFDNVTAHMVTDPSQAQYVGDPTPSIDSAWHALLDGKLVSYTSPLFYVSYRLTGCREIFQYYRNGSETGMG